MKQWPTRVRTGVPPFSRIDLGHGLRADEVVEDRRARTRARASPSPRIAVVSEPDTGWAALVDEEHPVGVAVEREADVGAGLEHPACRSRRFSGWIGSAGWFGNVPSSSAIQVLDARTGRPSNTRGHDEAAHAVGGVGHDLQRPQRAASTKERTWAA